MKLCPHIGCLYSQNSDTARFCNKCSEQLLLQDRYHLLRFIGCGGFSRTFLAVDEHKNRCVIKQLCFPEESGESFQKAVKLFRQEAVRLHELQHPQIPQLLGYFEQEHRLYLVQELIAGQTLAQELQAQGVFSETQIWELLKNLLPVLQFIHERQVIHRDIKPANIMRRSPLGDLVLIDFGVAKHFTATALLHTGTTIGSPEYIAPEQIRGKALPASDLYSLGVTCIYLLTGISPFDLFDVNSNCWVWRDYLLSGQTVSNYLGQILDQLLQNALSQRYKSAAEVLQALDLKPQLVKRSPVHTLDSEYHHLHDLLAMRKWQLADQETWALMCQAISKPIGSYLFSSDIEKLPCEDLQTIDQLWMQYSRGRFGFSVQKQIYESVNGDYGKFCTAIGWDIYNSTPRFNFSWSAPQGHLPSRSWAGGTQWWRHISVLAAKLVTCYPKISH
ncbi:serine/threonine-protein kinase [Halotia wernerae UHCC 0503]|nr:serine/threonine-protein kinase [Halotia wernerae UHCC 0503]